MTTLHEKNAEHSAPVLARSERKLLLRNQLLVSAFLPFLLCFSLPLEIYTTNSEEMLFVYSALLKSSVFVFLGLFCILFLVLQMATRFRWILANLLLSISICAWLSSSFFSTDYGTFNGTDLAVNLWSSSAIIELILWLSIISAIVLIPKFSTAAWNGAAILFAVIVIVTAIRGLQNIGVDLNLRQAMYAFVPKDSVRNQHWEQVPIFSSERNILHIILDEAQGAVVRRTLESHPEIANKLQGFYLFEDTAAVYPYTTLSLPAIFSGSIYDNIGSKKDYVNSALSENTFYEYLEDSGYDRTVHTHPLICATNSLDNCSGILTMSKYGAFLTLLDFSLLRATPQSATNLMYYQSAGVVSRILGGGAYQDSTTGLAWLDFNSFIDKIKTKEIPPTYKVFHSLISHAPLLLDANCNLLPEAAPNQLKPMVDQMQCSLHMVSELLSKLEAEGILDRTLIIISSDHGGNFAPDNYHAALDENNIKLEDFSRGDAILLVKPFHSQQEMTIVSTPAQLHQVGPIIQLLDQDSAGIDDIIEWLDLQPRQRQFNSMDGGVNIHTDKPLIDFRSYCIRGPIFKPSSWQKLDIQRHQKCQETQPTKPSLN